MKKIFYLVGLTTTIFLLSCNNQSSQEKTINKQTAVSPLKEEIVRYSANGTNMNGFIVYNDSIKEKRPAVMVVHEWWGLNDYPKSRARELAQLGYFAMAVDMYGNGQTASNPDEA